MALVATVIVVVAWDIRLAHVLRTESVVSLDP
jgi:hypothetical protein